jgi:tetratricopeptide (TPR) repeat protein
VNAYSRKEVLRILRIRSTQLLAWERAGLITAGESYSFQHLVQLRKLRDLRATRLTVASICASVHAMKAVSGMSNPLLEAGAVRRGSRLLFRHSGAMMEPIARQFAFDFEAAELTGPPTPVGSAFAQAAAREARIASLFVQAVRLEESGAAEQAAASYETILSLDPRYAPAAINLGTLCYHRRAFDRAEELYRRAAVADPQYALAFFDLGNVLDETHRLPEAIDAYRTAIQLVPAYGDAHYNLALAYERCGERRRALRHWTAYLKLDPVGKWADHARGQVKKILAREKLVIVYRSATRLRSFAALAPDDHGLSLPVEKRPQVVTAALGRDSMATPGVPASI